MLDMYPGYPGARVPGAGTPGTRVCIPGYPGSGTQAGACGGRLRLDHDHDDVHSRIPPAGISETAREKRITRVPGYQRPDLLAVPTYDLVFGTGVPGTRNTRRQLLSGYFITQTDENDQMGQGGAERGVLKPGRASERA
eukprot:1898761-Rhodomonas_salina.1